ASTGNQALSGGNGGAFRNNNYSFPYGGNPPEGLRIADLMVSANYTPSVQGPIQSLSFSVDYNLISQSGGTPGSNIGIILLQNSTYYLGPDIQTISTMGTWQTYSLGGRAALDFSRVAGTGSLHPDFSGSGSLIQLGYELSI